MSLSEILTECSLKRFYDNVAEGGFISSTTTAPSAAAAVPCVSFSTSEAWILEAW